MKELCYRCNEETPCTVVHHPSGTEWLCAVCGWQVDFMHDEEAYDYDPYDEPVDSCLWCGTNIYGCDDFGTGLCDQCQWSAEKSNPFRS